MGLRRLFRIFLGSMGVVLWLGVYPANSADRVNFMVDFLIGGKHVPFLAAAERGFYQKAGIDATILRGWGSGATAKALADAKVAFGFADAGVTILGRTKGMKVLQIGMIHSISPMAWVARRSAGIERPKDLEGKLFAASAGSSITILLPVFARAAGIDFSKIRRMTVDPALEITTLLSGKSDFTGAYTTTNIPVMKVMLKNKGVDPDRELVIFKAGNYGLDLYSNGLCATDMLIAEKPELVKRFVQASFEGLRWSARNPQEALEILLRKQPTAGKELARMQFIETIRTVLSKETREIALGWMAQDKMERTKRVILETQKLSTSLLSTEELYTNQFLSKRPLRIEEVAAVFH